MENDIQNKQCGRNKDSDSIVVALLFFPFVRRISIFCPFLLAPAITCAAPNLSYWQNQKNPNGFLRICQWGSLHFKMQKSQNVTSPVDASIFNNFELNLHYANSLEFDSDIFVYVIQLTLWQSVTYDSYLHLPGSLAITMTPSVSNVREFFFPRFPI